MRTHGTRSKYQAGCRCRRCRTAKAKAERRYRAECGADSMVLSRRTLHHLEKLNVSAVVIARLTGLKSSTIYKLRDRKRILKSTETAILKVDHQAIQKYYWRTPKGFLPRAPVEQLVGDLRLSGFDPRELGIRFQGKQVQAKNARTIEQIYRTIGTKAA